MNQIKIFTLALFLTVYATPSKGDPPPTVPDFDLERYQGTWNQLSAIPASFQRKCVANTTAEYSLLPNGFIKVVNSCNKKNGKRRSSEARARIDSDFDEDSKLEVTFVKFFKWIWAFGGDYWVLHVSDNYDVSIVGDSHYKYGWILSKKGTLTDTEYQQLGLKLQSLGYDSCEFIMSNTKEQNFNKEVRLCEYL